MAGVVILLIGIQLRLVDSFVLNDSSTRFINTRITGTSDRPGGQLLQAVGTIPKRIVHPPEWLGWALISIGSVLILHSLAMKAPGAEH